MNGKKKTMRIPLTTWLLLAAALVLLLASGLQTARGALTYYSETYRTQVQMFDIGLTLTENGQDISKRDYDTQKGDDNWLTVQGVLVQNMLAEGESLKLGKTYPEALAIRNSGTIDQYARVAVSCYWTDANGKKLTTLSPKLIDLHLLTGSNGWVEDTAAATPERRVLYYTKVLKSGETAPDFSDTLTLSTALSGKVSETRTTDANGLTTITTTYDYDGVQFVIEASADAVQTHNAVDAIKSAWGVNVAIAADGGLSLQ